MVEVRRAKMCKNKVSFTNKAAAIRAAERHNQNVYECPICFCFHCTSRQDWRDEFVPIEKFHNVMRELERIQKAHTSLKKVRQRMHEIRALNMRLLKIVKKYKARTVQ